MNHHQYILQPYEGAKSRHHCPACNKPQTFSRYIDADTRQEIAPNVGRCNRESNCGYWYTDKQYFKDNKKTTQSPRPVYLPKNPTPPKPTTYIPFEIVEKSLKNYQNNHFATFLISTFGADVALQVIARYNVGTSKHWQRATVFWQMDNRGNVRTGKVMLYNSHTGKRVKEPHNYFTWVHKLIKQADSNPIQCLFGEHLLSKEPGKTVCLVESEKTAIIASLYFPQYVWLATGGLQNLNNKMCQAIVDRKVILFPDLKGCDKWQAKAKQISPQWTVSDFIETHATEAEKAQGLDIADYLLNFALNKPLPQASQPPETVAPNSPILEPKPKIVVQYSTETKKNTFDNYPPTINWDSQISELETFFASIQIPANAIKLSPGATIINAVKFIHSHFEMVKGNNGNPAFLSYLSRLNSLKQMLQ